MERKERIHYVSGDYQKLSRVFFCIQFLLSLSSWISRGYKYSVADGADFSDLHDLHVEILP